VHTIIVIIIITIMITVKVTSVVVSAFGVLAVGKGTVARSS
jgi:hypothetical protein